MTKGPSVRGAEEAKAVEPSELTAPVVGHPGLGTFLHVAQVTRGWEGFCQQGVRPGSLVLQHSQPSCSSQQHTSPPRAGRSPPHSRAVQSAFQGSGHAHTGRAKTGLDSQPP